MTWLDQVLPSIGAPPDRLDWPGRREYETAWQRQLFEAGYAGINWPAEYGGRGATPTEHLIFLEESKHRHAPYVGMNFVGILHAGPTLIAEASEKQKAEHLPKILRGDEVWCQGFSEPNAGSDLASLQCKAVRDGDDYVVTGQKIWTSYAHVADYCELLVRTDTESKHGGISWLICPMGLDGMDVRPIDTVLGSSEFSEVFFDEVRIPVENLVGPENDGWRVAMVTFSFERGTAFISELLATMEQLADLAEVAKATKHGAGTWWDDGEVRRELGKLQAELDALWALTKRNVSQAQRDGAPGPGGSVFKFYYADLKKRMSKLAFEILDRNMLMFGGDENPDSNDHVSLAVYALSLSIAAGTSQIQRNIVGERILGLPKER